MNTNLIHKELSYKIVGLAMNVHSTLGYGFLEKVYENSLMILLSKEGIRAEQQKGIKVIFENVIVGEYFADIVINDQILLELKSVESLVDAHRSQVLNYLKATGLKLGILINFGKTGLEHQRFVL